MPKKEIEISYRANREQLRSEFAQGGFWFMVRGRVDDGKIFKVIEDAYVNARLLRGVVDVAVTYAARIATTQGTVDPESQGALRRAVKKLSVVNNKLTGLALDVHPSQQAIDDQVAVWSSNWLMTLEQVRGIAQRRGSRNRPEISERTVIAILEDIRTGREDIRVEIGSPGDAYYTAFPFPAAERLDFEQVLKTPAALRAIRAYCNRRRHGLAVASDLLALRWPSITLDIVRRARRRAKRRTRS